MFTGKIELHLVMGIYGKHKHPRVQCWLNWVDPRFGQLTGKRIRREAFVIVEDIEKGIEEFLAA